MADGWRSTYGVEQQKTPTNHPTLTSQSLHEQLLQSDSTGTAEIFNEYLRGAAKLALFDLMQEEVDRLCGPSHDRALPRPAHKRAGSEKGICYIEGTKEPIQRPRVRREDCEGTEEVQLASYQAAQQVNNIRERVTALLLEGVSTRGASRLSGSTVSKSVISEQWVCRVVFYRGNGGGERHFLPCCWDHGKA
jgi:transposase-like protein